MATRIALLITLLAVLLVPARAFADTDPVGGWPLMPESAVVAGFDPPADPWEAGHRGVDLLGAVGQPVRTALPGRVTWAGILAGRGVVVVDHGATRTTYEPVAATVSVGAALAAGDRIGRLALPGSHCLPRACLHWGWLEGETYLDPLRLVGAGPVRLLPLWTDRPVGDAPADPTTVLERVARPGVDRATGVSRPRQPRSTISPHPYARWVAPVRWLVPRLATFARYAPPTTHAGGVAVARNTNGYDIRSGALPSHALDDARQG